jgi:hypothetical protein
MAKTHLPEQYFQSTTSANFKTSFFSAHKQYFEVTVVETGVWLAVGASSSSFEVDSGRFVSDAIESYGLYDSNPSVGDIYSVFLKNGIIQVFKNGEQELYHTDATEWPLYPTVSIGIC